MSILQWLSVPLREGAPVLRWHVLAAAAAALLLTAPPLLALLAVRRKRKRRARAMVTLRPHAPPPVPGILTVGNLQGLGKRETQQDAFAVSSLERMGEQGLFALVCDGMGGMEDGGEIARKVTEYLRQGFSFDPSAPEALDTLIRTLLEAANREVYAEHFRRGGTTVVAVHIWQDAFRFWSVGDSDIFLYRKGRLYAVNLRQEYQNDLMLEAVRGKMDPEDAMQNPQASALSAFIGDNSLRMDASRQPIPLEPGDKLLLCSDGISDALHQGQMEAALAYAPPSACDRLEEAILAAAKSGQDNYTAVIIGYSG